MARARTGRTGLDRERLAGRFASRESREPRIEERPWGESVGERRARHARARARGSLRGAMRAHRGARVLRGPPAFVGSPRASRTDASRIIARSRPPPPPPQTSTTTSTTFERVVDVLPLASASGVVVTSQANFLRVVVRPQDMSPAKSRTASLSCRARWRAPRRLARRRTSTRCERIDDANGPYELLCVVRALLKKSNDACWWGMTLQ